MRNNPKDISKNNSLIKNNKLPDCPNKEKNK